VADAKLQGPAQEPTAGAPHPSEPQFTVYGKPVTEFRALIDGQAGAFITSTGAFMFSRVYFAEGQFDLGDGKGRLGATGQKVQGGRWDSEGLTVWTQDYLFEVPRQAVKATWRRSA
jgi:hypothetical protein